ncbi:MAG: hypothetical protein LCH38_00720 [Proteobacteria bacterium]|nr:hypothetical protein [Pseudomonadota bacterium]
MPSEHSPAASSNHPHAHKPHGHGGHAHDHHHHAPSRPFPGRSLLALAAWQRLLLAAPLIAALWLLTFWALHHG